MTTRYTDALIVSPSASLYMAFALLLVRDFGRAVPEIKTLQERYDMHKASAYRWRAAYAAALGQSIGCHCIYSTHERVIQLALKHGAVRPDGHALASELNASRSTGFRYRQAWDVLEFAA